MSTYTILPVYITMKDTGLIHGIVGVSMLETRILTAESWLTSAACQ